MYCVNVLCLYSRIICIVCIVNMQYNFKGQKLKKNVILVRCMKILSIFLKLGYHMGKGFS